MDLRELPAGAFARHPWETARADFFLRLLREHLPCPGVDSALDVGAGDGYLARRLLTELPGLARVTCFDPEYQEAWLRAQPPPSTGLGFTRVWPDRAFGLVLLLDVLEHADDDRGLLARAVAHAGPGAAFLLSAPAHPALFSRHDVLLGHRRRYSSFSLRTLVSTAGLELIAHGQLFASLLVPRALASAVEAATRRHTSAPDGRHVETPLGTWHHGRMVTRAASSVLALDAAAGRMAARWGLPLPGLSTWVLARKP